jgi:lipopolysaccharide transport system permease protein
MTVLRDAPQELSDGVVPAEEPAHAPPIRVVIEAKRGVRLEDLRELWDYRELLAFLIWRDVKVRYRQTVLGAAWAVLQPLTTMVVFSVFFGRLGKLPSDGHPYPLFAFAALVPWSFFATGLTHGATSLISSAKLLKKVYFPRLVLPLASILAGVIDFSISMVILLLMMVGYGEWPTLNVVWVPALFLLAMITSLGVGLWLSALNVQFRDVQYTLPFLTQLWLFATPIAYPSSMVPEQWRPLMGLNPMAGVVEGFRWALLGTDTRPGPLILVSALVSVTVFVTGVYYFKRMERSFADIV